MLHKFKKNDIRINEKIYTKNYSIRMMIFNTNRNHTCQMNLFFFLRLKKPNTSENMQYKWKLYNTCEKIIPTKENLL